MLRQMGHSSAVGFLAFVLCLVACVSANSAGGVTETEPPEVNKETAEQAVSDAQNSITQVSEKATTNLSITKGVLEKVKSSKEKAEGAAVQAQREATDNAKAKTIVDNIKKISQGVTEQHDSVKEKLDRTIVSLESVVSEAEKFKDQLNAVLPLTETPSKKNLEAKAKALEIKGEADKLDTSITEALKAIDGVSSTADKMEESAKDAELKKLQVSVIVAVAQIEKMIKEVNSNIEETENKKDEVNRIVQQMNKHCTTPYAESNKIIKALCDSAKEALTSATGAVNKAKKAKEDIGKQQEPANTALQNFQGEKALSEAPNEIAKAKECVAKVKEIEDQLQTALETANNAVANVNDAKKKLETALSTTTTEPNTEQNTETEKSNPSVGQGREANQQDKAIQPTSTDSPDQSNNSEEKLKDTLIKGAQNMPTTALTGGKAPAPGAKNDSAMTVSVPLLVALIASAVLQ